MCCMKVKMGIVVIICVIAIGIILILIKLLLQSIETIKRMKKLNSKMVLYYNIYSKWIELRIKGKRLATYLEEAGIYNVIVYGYGPVGINFVEDLLESSNINIVCIIDNGIIEQDEEICVKSIENAPKDVDAVIVTTVHVFDNINLTLKKEFACPILSLQDIIYKV